MLGVLLSDINNLLLFLMSGRVLSPIETFLFEEEVSCSDPLVYNVNSAQNTAVRGKNAQGTQTSFNNICCVQPTCGVLHALDSNKYNCGKIDPRLTRDFEYNARTMSSKSTT